MVHRAEAWHVRGLPLDTVARDANQGSAAVSKSSKIRRDARRKDAPTRSIRRLGGSLQMHAHLKDTDGRVVAGAGLRDGEWVMLLAGRAVATTESAALMLAMLRHTADVQSRAGVETTLGISQSLGAAATAEAEAAGRSLADHLAFLETERQSRNDPAPPRLH